VGKVLAETPLELVMPIVFSVITYWMVGLADDGGSFVFFVVIMCLFVLMGSGIGLFLGATMVDVKKALTLSTIVVLGSILLGTHAFTTAHTTRHDTTRHDTTRHDTTRAQVVTRCVVLCCRRVLHQPGQPEGVDRVGAVDLVHEVLLRAGASQRVQGGQRDLRAGAHFRLRTRRAGDHRPGRARPPPRRDLHLGRRTAAPSLACVVSCGRVSCVVCGANGVCCVQIIFVVGVIVVSRVLAYLSLRYLNKPKR
jgi:hypothetical protein